MKQWNQKPADLAPSVCGRIPIRFNRQNDYVNHKYKVMPKLRFSEMFKAMTSNPLIKFSYNTDYEKIRGRYVQNPLRYMSNLKKLKNSVLLLAIVSLQHGFS